LHAGLVVAAAWHYTASAEQQERASMKVTRCLPVTAAVPQRKRPAKDLQPRAGRGGLEGVKPAQSRAQQKTGGYKRVEIFLGVEAAIALRQLMRDGRSAREVVETLLLAEKQRRKEHASA
jgi:hypothetical protein